MLNLRIFYELIEIGIREHIELNQNLHFKQHIKLLS